MERWCSGHIEAALDKRSMHRFPHRTCRSEERRRCVHKKRSGATCDIPTPLAPSIARHDKIPSMRSIISFMHYKRSKKSVVQNDQQFLLSLSDTDSVATYTIDLPTKAAKPTISYVDDLPRSQDIAEMLDDDNMSWVPTGRSRRSPWLF